MLGALYPHNLALHEQDNILVCLLGEFRVLRAAGSTVALREGGKGQALLARLALQLAKGLRREALLDALWPERDPPAAGQSLNTLVYSLHRLLGDEIGGAQPIVRSNGVYRLNFEAGMGVDLMQFERYVRAGDRQRSQGDEPAAIEAYQLAIALYGGDLFVEVDVDALVERERLRAMYLTVLATVADYHYRTGHTAFALDHALLLLSKDPCREDAHRLVMRCRVRQGERAAALRQYTLCLEILRSEFDALPEHATRELFERVRSAPETI